MQVDPPQLSSTLPVGPSHHTAAFSPSPALPQHPIQQSPVEQRASLGPERQGELAPLVTVEHRVIVPAVHRLHSPSLPSLQANIDQYGKEASEIHGHEWEFEVRFRGPVCRKTGQIMGSGLLEDVSQLAIVEVLSRKNLDVDIPFFHTRPSTLENVALFAWRNLSVIMAPHSFDVCEVAVSCEICPWKGKGRAGRRKRVCFSGEMITIPAQS